jgi:hypothetical protein
MIQQLPYCGAAASPGELLTGFNFDPLLILALLVICTCHLIALRNKRGAGVGLYQAYANQCRSSAGKPADRGNFKCLSRAS